VAPAGAGDGREAASALSLGDAIRTASAGDVVCLLPGTYEVAETLYLMRSGTREQPLVFRSTGGVARLVYTAGRGGDTIQVTSGTAWIEIRGLVIDGGGTAYTGVKCNKGGHHVRVSGLTVRNTGAAGIAAVGCDYLTFDHNTVFHSGYRDGWSSAISINEARWHDRAAGFHSVIANNVLTGMTDESDHHSDGNGIILDLGGDTPPALVTGNVVTENGGRCIHSFHVRHVWIVGNTCYKNALDTRLSDPRSGYAGEITVYDAQDVHLVNNAAAAWTNMYPYSVAAGSEVQMRANVAFGGRASTVPEAAARDERQFRLVDPGFANPRSVPDEGDRLFDQAPDAAVVGDGLRPASDSPLVDAGVDPRSDPALTPELRAGLERWAVRDALGVAHGQHGGWDIGAFEHTAG
jgi:hypothetical protein